MTRKPKPAAPGSTIDTEAMIRVDHAGEYGAVRIYQGQLAVLKNGGAADTIRHMAQQEQRHLKAFDKLVNERRVRPTALEPIWRVAGFALGFGTALMGEKAAFGPSSAVAAPSAKPATCQNGSSAVGRTWRSPISLENWSR